VSETGFEFYFLWFRNSRPILEPPSNTVWIDSN